MEDNKQHEHHTSTEELFVKFNEATNPVTKAAYRSMIASRLGITERQELVTTTNVWAIRDRMRKLTYSFDGRKNMEEYFKKYQGMD